MIHIIGANGYIGNKLCHYMDNKLKEYDCYSNIVDEKCKRLDLRTFNGEDLYFKPKDVVVLLSAISSPDICQNNYDFAYSINVLGTSRFIDYCISKQCKVIFLSSDAVNGETSTETGNDEYSEVKPFGNCAKMKYEIEQKYKNCNLFKTLRLSYVLSNEDKFSKYLRQCIDKRETAEVFDGIFRNAVLLETVIEAIFCLCENFDFNNHYLINVSGNQCLSRKELAERYKKYIDGKLDYRIIPVPDFILKGRPNIIKTKSLFLEKLIGYKLKDIL